MRLSVTACRAHEALSSSEGRGGAGQAAGVRPHDREAHGGHRRSVRLVRRRLGHHAMIDHHHAMIDYHHRYDASATSLMWLSDAERTAELARQEAAEEAERRERELAKKNVVSFDFAGRKVIGRGGGGGVAGALGGFQESSQAVAAAEQQAAQSWHGGAATASEAAAAAAAAGAGAAHHSAFANPFLRGPRPNYLGGGGGAQRTGGSGQAGPEVASSGGGGRAARSSRGTAELAVASLSPSRRSKSRSNRGRSEAASSGCRANVRTSF
eukprot:COSAG01_NODE_13434_length_1586_cov_0.709482_2_plen_268_part_00